MSEPTWTATHIPVRLGIDFGKMTRNRAACPECEDVLESTHRHDLKTCSCGNLSIDGGLAYAKRMWSKGMPVEMCEYGPLPERTP